LLVLQKRVYVRVIPEEGDFMSEGAPIVDGECPAMGAAYMQK
jgi:hypothetical protein